MRRHMDAPSTGRRVVSAGFSGPKTVELFSLDAPPVEDGQFFVRTLYTGISAGTELTQFRGTNQYLTSVWDERLKLFLPSEGRQTSQTYPLRATGYMEVGRVEESHTGSVRVGETVCMAYGHKSGHVATASQQYFARLPEDVDPVLGIYVAQMGPICANGILHADEDALGERVTRLGEGVRGRTVAVFGAGPVGLLVALMARWAGAAEVAIVDRAPDRLAVAQRLGLLPVSSADTHPAVFLKERWQTGDPGDRGADMAFQCSGSDVLLQFALESLRPQCTVVDLGFYQGGAPEVRFGEVFHHNGLRHLCAQIRRVPRRLTATWNRRRLSEETVAFLRDTGPAIREHLITHVAPFSEAQRIYDLLDRTEPGTLQTVLTP
jgi:NADPH:quinone reductase-like Zn-dependent oxidoreductase